MAINSNKGISVKILGKDYHVSCPEGQQHNLLDAAFLVNKMMAEIRQTGRIVGLDKITVMAALNIANDLLTQIAKAKAEKEDLERRLTQLYDKMNKVLTNA